MDLIVFLDLTGLFYKNITIVYIFYYSFKKGKNSILDFILGFFLFLKTSQTKTS